MYQLLVLHFHLVSIRRDLKKKDRNRLKKIFGAANQSNLGGQGQSGYANTGFSEYASKQTKHNVKSSVNGGDLAFDRKISNDKEELMKYPY